MTWKIIIYNDQGVRQDLIINKKYANFDILTKTCKTVSFFHNLW